MKHQTFIATTADPLHQEFLEKLAAAVSNDNDDKQKLDCARKLVYEYYPAIHEARIEALRARLAGTTDPMLRRALGFQIAGYEKAVDRVKETVAQLNEESG